MANAERPGVADCGMRSSECGMVGRAESREPRAEGGWSRDERKGKGRSDGVRWLEIEDVALAETFGKPLGQSRQGLGNFGHFEASDARRAQHDPGMGLLSANGILGQDHEMAHVPGDQTPTFLGSAPELIPI